METSELSTPPLPVRLPRLLQGVSKTTPVTVLSVLVLRSTVDGFRYERSGIE